MCACGLLFLTVRREELSAAVASSSSSTSAAQPSSTGTRSKPRDVASKTAPVRTVVIHPGNENHLAIYGFGFIITVVIHQCVNDLNDEENECKNGKGVKNTLKS